MRCRNRAGWWKVMLVILVAIFTIFPIFSIDATRAFAQSNKTIIGRGELRLTDTGAWALSLKGNMKEVGPYTCYGEIDFAPGAREGAWDGEGVVVFTTANGDLLVGEVTWQIAANGSGQIAFDWKDKVTFDDGTTVTSTGGFVKRKPRGSKDDTKVEYIKTTLESVLVSSGPL